MCCEELRQKGRRKGVAPPWRKCRSSARGGSWSRSFHARSSPPTLPQAPAAQPTRPVRRGEVRVCCSCIPWRIEEEENRTVHGEGHTQVSMGDRKRV
eukprot:2966130-Rhodomonas_salina.1